MARVLPSLPWFSELIRFHTSSSREAVRLEKGAGIVYTLIHAELQDISGYSTLLSEILNNRTFSCISAGTDVSHVEFMHARQQWPRLWGSNEEVLGSSPGTAKRPLCSPEQALMTNPVL